MKTEGTDDLGLLHAQGSVSTKLLQQLEMHRSELSSPCTAQPHAPLQGTRMRCSPVQERTSYRGALLNQKEILHTKFLSSAATRCTKTPKGEET